MKQPAPGLRAARLFAGRHRRRPPARSTAAADGTYSQVPCAGGTLVEAADPRTAAQRAEARRVAARERKAAQTLDAIAVAAEKPRPRHRIARPSRPRPRHPRATAVAWPRARSRGRRSPRSTATSWPSIRSAKKKSLAPQVASHLAAGAASCCRRRYLAHSVSWRLDMRRVHRDAAHRADLHALRLVEVADAFGAARRVDLVDLRAHRDRLVRALGLAHIAVDAFVGDQQGHGVSLRGAFRARWTSRARAAGRAPRVTRTWRHHRPRWQSRARRCR